MGFRHYRRASSIDFAFSGWHNFVGCWSSPLTAQRADDSYEEGESFLVGVCVLVPLNPRGFRSSVAQSERDACLRLGKQVM